MAQKGLNLLPDLRRKPPAVLDIMAIEVLNRRNSQEDTAAINCYRISSDLIVSNVYAINLKASKSCVQFMGTKFNLNK